MIDLGKRKNRQLQRDKKKNTSFSFSILSPFFFIYLILV
jgi:hypothetical protein